MGTLVGRPAREPHLLSTAVFLPLAAHQPELARRNYRDSGYLLAADCERAGRQRAPGAADLCHGAARAGGPDAVFFAAAGDRRARSSAPRTLPPGVRRAVPVGRARLPRQR